MKTTRRMQKIFTMLLGIVFALAGPQMASAGGTAACTQITNTATLSYSVGSVPQPNVSNTPGGADAFYVGVKVNLAVTRQDGAEVSVTPGQTAVALTYRVTNTGNAPQKYALTATAQANGTANPFGGPLTDLFDGTNIITNGTAGTTSTIASIAPDGFQNVTVVVDIPTSVVDTNIAVYTLKAQSQWVGSSTNITADGTAAGSTINDGGTCSALGATTVDVVVADTTAGSDDAPRDGAHSVRDAYKVASAVLSISKTATTIWDPINGNSGQKSIPGALIRYAITISNAAGASASATLTQISDALSGNLTMDADLKMPAACAAPPCALASLADESAAGSGFKATVGGTSTRAGFPKYYTTTSSADGVDLAGATVTATMSTVLPLEAGYTAGQLKPGESVTLTFNVVVN